MTFNMFVNASLVIIIHRQLLTAKEKTCVCVTELPNVPCFLAPTADMGVHEIPTNLVRKIAINRGHFGWDTN